jgi:hypothetical protein
VDPASFRAGDADRERVAERLRVALEEGRLNLNEYDERLRDALAARTYAELDALLVDLPGVTPVSRSALNPSAAEPAARWQPGPDGRYPHVTRRWVVSQWDGWFRVVAVCVGIWTVISVLYGRADYFWPVWVAAPWGAVILLHTVRGLVGDEPQRWAAKEARKDAEREVRRRARERDGE